MPDPHYPSVDISFIIQEAEASGKLAVDGIIKFGSTTTLVIAGPQAVYKRSILLRELEPGQVCLEQATGIAFRLSFLGHLLEWLEKNRNWKDGGYTLNSH
jgi:hypothetical protein